MFKKSNVITGVNVSKIVLGNALMYNAEIFSSNGLIIGILLILVLGGVFAHMSLYILFKATFAAGIKKYEDLMVAAFGKRTRAVVKSFVLILCIFSICTYVDIVRAVLSRMELTDTTNIYVCVCIFVTINAIFVKHSQLAFANVVGMVAIVIFGTISYMKSYQNKSIDEIVMFRKNGKIVESIGRISLTFCYHFCVMPFLKNIDGEEGVVDKSLMFITSIAAVISVIIHIFIGVTGYIAYPDTKPLWFENVVQADPVVFYILLITTLVITVLNVPMCFIGVAQEYEKFLPNSKFKIESRIVGALIMVVIVVFGKILARNVFAKCLVSMITSFVMFIFPGFCFLKIASDREKHCKRISWVCIGFGCILIVKTLYDFVENIFLLFIK